MILSTKANKNVQRQKSKASSLLQHNQQSIQERKYARIIHHQFVRAKINQNKKEKIRKLIDQRIIARDYKHRY